MKKQTNLLEKWQKDSLFSEKYKFLIEKKFRVEKERVFNSYLIYVDDKLLDLGHLNFSECKIAINTIFVYLNLELKN